MQHRAASWYPGSADQRSVQPPARYEILLGGAGRHLATRASRAAKHHPRSGRHIRRQLPRRRAETVTPSEHEHAMSSRRAQSERVPCLHDAQAGLLPSRSRCFAHRARAARRDGGGRDPRGPSRTFEATRSRVDGGRRRLATGSPTRDLRSRAHDSDKAELDNPRPAHTAAELQWICDAILLLALRLGEWAANATGLPLLGRGDMPPS